LKKFLDGKPSLEARQRIDKLLDKLATLRVPSETLQGLRAVEVLEKLGTPDARKLLERLAQGAAGARLTRDATASLDRLARPAANP
jgi:hypothetical protein